MSQTKAQLLEGTAAENVTVDNIVTTSVNGGQLSHRNRVINGAMEINQRASSYTATGEEYTLDRFEHRTGSGFTFDTTTTQSTSAPAGFTKSLKITPDSTQTPSGSHNGMVGQLIEANNLVGFAHGTSSAKKSVLSFYAKSASQNNNHQYTVQLNKLASSGQYYYVNKAFTVTSSWQRFTVAFAADTSNDITTGTGEGFRILFHLAAGSSDIGSEVSTWTAANGNFAVTGQSNFMDNTSNEFYLTGVQLEASDSDVATDFEHRSFAQELLICQRYCQKLGASEGTYDAMGTGAAFSSTVSFIPYSLKVAMRSTPSFTLLGSESDFKYTRSTGEHTPDSITFDQGGNNMCALRLAGSSKTVDAAVRLYNTNTTGGYLFTAEL